MTSEPNFHAESPEQTGHVPPAPEFAPTPRALTRRIKSRAWGEKHVRGWVTLFLVMVVIMAGMAISEGMKWSTERTLITQGIKLQGKMVTADKELKTIPNHFVHPGDMVGMTYEIDGHKYRELGPLLGFDKMVQYATPIEIRVDPKNPAVWTSRTEPLPLWHALLGSLMLVPIAVVLFMGALINRWQVLRTYRDGQLVAAEVMGVKQSAMSPGSRVIRCVVNDAAESGRVLSTLLPTRLAQVSPGDVIWILARPGRSHKGVPAALFD